MSKEKQIELLEKQLAFWKHHCTELANELKKEEEIANHYAEMLDKTEEELNTEREKNEKQGYRKQSELIPCDCCRFNPPSSTDGKPCSVCPAQAKMKGGE